MESEVCSVTPSEWEILPLTKICKKITSGSTPSRKKPEYFIDGKWCWVKTKELKDDFITDTEEKITDEAISNSSAKLLPKHTVLLAIYAVPTLGRLGILSKPMACNQACCAFVVDETKSDYRYLFYQLFFHRKQLQSQATGAAQQNISGDFLKSFKLPFPKLSKQTKISDILFLFDNKIRLLKKQNNALENIIQSIFKSWFIDFDGQPEFEHSEFGEIPKGWKIQQISDLCKTIENGGTPKRKEEIYWNNGTINWFKTGELTDGFLFESKEKISEIGLKNSSCHLWPAGTLLIAIYAFPVVGRLGILTNSAASNQACSALIPKSQIHMLFLFYSILFSREKLGRIATGAAQQNISQEIVRSHKIIVPPIELISKFNDAILPLSNMIRTNEVLKSTTIKTRNHILPKLLSGEIIV
jgi:type I restriction enzyme, S subunit